MSVNFYSESEAFEVLSETMGQEVSSTGSNARVEDVAIEYVETLAEDKNISNLCTGVEKDKTNYVDEIAILRAALEKYDAIFNLIQQAADAEFDTANSAFESCQSDYNAKEQEMIRCQNILYATVDKTIETKIYDDGYCPNVDLNTIFGNLSDAKVNLDNGITELKIVQDQFAVVEARYNAAKSRCDSDKLLAEPRASIESMLSFSKHETNTD